jgi:hypothetical protein
MGKEGAQTGGMVPEIGAEPAFRTSSAQLRYLRLGMNAAGGKLPLFDGQGQEISPKTIRACVEHGWVQPWFSNPIKPDWLVCRLTPAGKELLRRFDEQGQD